MYVGYAITIACIAIVSFILYFFAGNPSEWIYIGVVVAIMLLIVPFNYRYSRILYLHFFGGIKFDKQYSR
jgi:cell division protein FtsW (lipid II flippase)